MASRTTHPLSLSRLQNLLDLVLPEAPRISNPYEWMTKTEVVERITRFAAEDMVSTAVSCTKVRDQTNLHTHCGSCSQCLDRRFAVLKAGLADADPSGRYETDVIFGSRNPSSATLPVEWTKHFLQLSEMDDVVFLAHFGTELARIFEAYPMASKETLFKRVLDLHRRQAKIVLNVLQSEVERNSAALAGRSLSPSCLLILHLGQFGEIQEPSYPQIRQRVLDPQEEGDEEEMPSIFGEPLTLAFDERNGGPIVRVLGLCRFTHKVAKVTFELRKQHEIDRSEELTREQFRYIHVANKGSLTISKEDVRVMIARGRKLLSKAYRDMHGQPPPQDLLFQTKQGRGYRLNPLTRISNNG